jgi:hypothetical protein
MLMRFVRPWFAAEAPAPRGPDPLVAAMDANTRELLAVHAKLDVILVAVRAGKPAPVEGLKVYGGDDADDGSIIKFPLHLVRGK